MKQTNIISVVVILLMLIINLVLVLMLIKRKRNNNSSDNIMKEILDKVSTNELNFVDSSAINIIQVLKKNYKIDYCSILIGDDTLNIIATDVDEIYQSEIADYCNRLMSKTKGKAIINSSDETYLDYPSAEKRTIKYSYFIPLGNIGALYIENYSDYKNNNFEIDFFNTVMKNIGIILQNCIYQDKLSNLAMKDNLTNLYNRNYMNKHMEVLEKNNNSIILAIMDIDNFKGINDTYGHDFGDVVLKQSSNFIKSKLNNETDEIYRWGGEEFIISFVEQELDDAFNKLDLIREELSKYIISDGQRNLKITASFGITEYDKTLSIEECIKKADNGLYISKSNGRNQINIGE